MFFILSGYILEKYFFPFLKDIVTIKRNKCLVIIWNQSSGSRWASPCFVTKSQDLGKQMFVCYKLTRVLQYPMSQTQASSLSKWLPQLLQLRAGEMEEPASSHLPQHLLLVTFGHFTMTKTPLLSLSLLQSRAENAGEHRLSLLT